MFKQHLLDFLDYFRSTSPSASTLQVHLRESEEKITFLNRQWENTLEELNRARIEAQVAEDALRRCEAEVQEWKSQFFAQVGKKDEARDAHQKALELVIDWESQRLTGRQVFNHAPLLVQDKAPSHYVPLGGGNHVPARDRVRQQEKEFNEEDQKRRKQFFDEQTKAHQAVQKPQ